MHDHTSSHLFECKSLPTSLSSLDLWTNPDKVEPFLATWGRDCWLPHDSGAGLCWQHVGGVGSTTTTTTTRTQLELQRAIDAYVCPLQHIRIIDRAVYFTVQYHPGLPDIKGTMKKFLPFLNTSERMSMVFSRPPVVSLSHAKNLNNYVGLSFGSLRNKPSRVNHAKAIAASSVPPLLLLAASPAPTTVEHSIVATRVRIAMRSRLCI